MEMLHIICGEARGVCFNFQDMRHTYSNLYCWISLKYKNPKYGVHSCKATHSNAQLGDTPPCTYLAIFETNIPYHASKYFVTNLNVDKKKLKESRENSHPPTHPYIAIKKSLEGLASNQRKFKL